MELRNSISQILAIMVRNCAMLSFGMTLGFQTILIGGVLQDTDNFTNVGDHEVSWLGSTLWLALVVGCLGSGFLTEPIGRKRSMQLVTIPYVSSWIGFYFATKIWHLYLILIIMGFFSGVLEGPSITYVSEVSQPHLRGAMAISGAIAVTCGTFIQFLLGTFYNWRTCALISCVFPLLTFCMFFLVPESPQWLLSNNKLQEAKKGLAWVRGWTTVENVELEINTISQQLFVDNSLNKTVTLKKYLSQFFGRNFLCPLGLVSFIFCVATFTGGDTLQTYAITIFATMRIPISEYYATLLLGFVQVLGALINIGLLRALGKRRLVLIALLCISICNIVIAAYAYLSKAFYITLLKDSDVLSGLDMSSYTWIPITFLILLSLINQCGVYSLPWILMTEVFPYETRGVGSGICSGVSSFLSFLSNNLFLIVVSQVTVPGIYCLHSVIGVVGIIVLYIYLTETEGKTVESSATEFTEKPELVKKIQSDQCAGVTNLSFECDGHYVKFNDDFTSRL
ncbi:hypothetical protein PPYR_01511 [Photinus pyralis]|uniref:Major facilitator superfamily (MFS) profile domain-containing protein n=1 Tax=Photinus pyralis TaxID=7054 RepID=A0A1Y1LY48_PHOPY|nr:facilitated trehalose transporter Tret1-like [Photinus pyralis]XP_031349032.1 facilitated trehalose transporter Tret1-like [Photinus pyralis]XP_031349040.1 facilitated trehalose transporter Tret1-like [Photinus pyralis]KAB0804541.1 hypothetical protein PPYR_01511 [Photinus pyralis]